MNAQTRFTKLDATGAPLPVDATHHVFLVDNALGVMHQVEDLTDPLPWNAANEACQASRALGFDNWRAPTPHEATGLIDYSRYNPAIDPALLPNAKSGGVWTSEPDASAPRDFAWVVLFGNGYVLLNHQLNRFRVRAVRSCVPVGQ